MRSLIRSVLIVGQVLKALMEDDFTNPTMAIMERYSYFPFNG